MRRAYTPTYTLICKLGFRQSTVSVIKRRREDGGFDVIYLNQDGTISLWTSDGTSIWSGLKPIADKVVLRDEEHFHELVAQFPTSPLTHVVAPHVGMAAAIGVLMVASAIFLPGELKAAALLPGLYFFS